ncbi:dynamin family protein [Pseudomonas sp. DCB_CB]|uniref:50S ribosome-binding GTPase n=1 Tax=Pseudomonas putida TaxID=303 RepID=A0A7W2L410_PSEPU|nr:MULTISPECIES: dynamin family protein [Pseudomonas]MBA6117975.1 50S ribosome-binding GTPase [Pseudomonas putida]MCX2690937.1 dynamin family protein [Pseudomonas sp. DCB_BZ]MCX2856080.1 dynamin family protein [Pseudomonas sp. DCB_CB]MCZ9635803.1 dynamin family protein [Pseudomonas putida]NQD55173.1 GTP-binding protein [Pseudomonas sp. CM25]
MTRPGPMTQLLALYEEVDGLCETYNPQAVASIRELSRAKKAQAGASIMVYGVYNAGKSTLINALLGQELAAVADVPETARVQGYRWGDFEVLDTPGIDAPLEHEAITREQLVQSDVVIFVVNPLGVVEEEKTLDVLLELVLAGKMIFLVLNCKSRFDPIDLARIKDELSERIQQKAGNQKVLGHIPIVEVNARSALKAKLENKQNLLNSSGFPKFESDLAGFFASVEQKAIVARVATELRSFLDATVAELDKHQDQASIKRLDAFYGEIARREIDIRHGLKSLIEAKAAYVGKSTITALNQNIDGAQGKIEQLIGQANEQICSELEDALTRLGLDASEMLDEVIREVQVQPQAYNAQAAPDLDTPEAPADQAPASQGIDLSLLESGVRQASSMLKAEHVVSVLKVGKQWLPTLFKGVGPVTMGKVAEQIVGKVIPVIGIAFQVGSTLYSAFAGDPDQQRLEEQAKREAQERERRDQAIQTFADETAWEFSRSLNTMVDTHLKTNFAEIKDKLQSLRGSLGQDQRRLSEDRERLVQCQAAMGEYA